MRLFLNSLSRCALHSCIELVVSAARRLVRHLSGVLPKQACVIGTVAPGRWGHHSPLPQYQLGKTGVAIAKRRARKARFWQGDGHGRP